jgi:hypothetical protein
MYGQKCASSCGGGGGGGGELIIHFNVTWWSSCHCKFCMVTCKHMHWQCEGYSDWQNLIIGTIKYSMPVMNTLSSSINLERGDSIVPHFIPNCSLFCMSWLINLLSFHRTQLHKYEKERQKYQATHEELEKLVKSSQRTAMDFEAQLTDALKVKVCIVNWVINEDW